MKTKKPLIAIFIAVMLAIGVTSVALIKLDEPPKPQEKQQIQLPPTAHEQKDVVRFTAEPDKTALEQLTARAAIETKQSELGTYVDTIDGKKGGDGGKYWTFYIDGEMAQVGADTYVTKGGESIEWRFE